jgi:hypothetical protein
MVVGIKTLSPDAREWAIRSILKPQLRDQLRSGSFTRPARFDSNEEAIDALAELVDTQLTLSLEGRKQTMGALATGANESAPQIREILAALGDWDELVDGLRMRRSDRGVVPFSKSVFVVKTAPHDASGPRVFPACSNAFPVQVEEVLARHGLLPEQPARRQSPATDSSAYLMEIGPLITQAMRVKGLPEKTQWDDSEEERYPAAIRAEIKEALELAAGGPYTVDTDTILREEVFDPFFERLATHGREAELPRPIESGWITFGPKGFEYRFLGGELWIMRYLQKKGVVPFLDLPRAMVKKRPFQGARNSVPVPNVPAAKEECIFEKIPDGRKLPGLMLGWAAGVTFGSIPGTPGTQDFFRMVKETTVQMAGGDIDNVEYAVTNARVGKPDSNKRTRVGLIMRNDSGSLSGWGIPGYDFDKDIIRRIAIEQAEHHIRRMSPEGEFQREVEHLQRLGVQTMGILLASQRAQREGLILSGEGLRKRVELGM